MDIVGTHLLVGDAEITVFPHDVQQDACSLTRSGWSIARTLKVQKKVNAPAPECA